MVNTQISARKRIYLACPYTHPDPQKRTDRFNLVTHVAAVLMQEGHSVFSPITQGHAICQYGIDHGFDAWKETDLSIIEHWATDIFLLSIDGFKTSVGVQAELDYAQSLNIPISLLSINDTIGKILFTSITSLSAHAILELFSKNHTKERG